MDFELISFDRCPFVQRSVITLLHKKVDYQVTYIDLGNKPDWFLKISPLGRVPALRVKDGDRETVLFESAVINEFIDEVTPGRLLPEDPVARAQNRAWIEFGGALFMDTYKMSVAKTAAEFEDAQRTLADHLQRVEAVLDDGPYFNGKDFSLVDAAYAPFFMRVAIWSETLAFYDRSLFPKVAAWAEELLALPSVRDSVLEDMDVRVRSHARSQEVYLGQLLAA